MMVWQANVFYPTVVYRDREAHRTAKPMTLAALLADIRACAHCSAHLPLGPRPVVRAGKSARLMIIGQAPGTRVHATGIPWNDASGERLRAWLGLSSEQFYDERHVAIMPMGFCYPGRGRGGDLPPRPECAPRWHGKLRGELPGIMLTLLIGQYAHIYYLGERQKATLSETVAAYKEYLPEGFSPLVHPSPRNQRWLKNNPWFEKDVVPALRQRVQALLAM